MGGLERVVQGLATGQKAIGHDVRVLAIVEYGADVSAFAGPLEEVGVPLHVVELGARSYLAEIAMVQQTTKDYGTQVLHTHGYRPDLLHAPSARRSGIATVSTLHGSSRMGGISHLFEWMQERALRRFDAVVAVSKPLERSLQKVGVPDAVIHTIPNAWTPPAAPVSREEARAFFGAASDDLLLAFVGRLIPIKGCDVFVRALAEVKADGWRAVVVGDGPERESLEELSRALGLADNLHFFGAVPEAARYFAGLDLFVLSSRSEGTPMVLLEAMGAAVCPVVTAVGGVPDLISSEARGWVVPPEAPSRLADALNEALADPARCRTIGEECRAVVEENFSIAQWVRQHDVAYRAALSRRAGGR